MITFAQVLADAQARAERDRRPAAARRRPAIALLPAEPSPVASVREAREAYADALARPRTARPAATPDIVVLRNAIAAAGSDARRLRTLRRTIARAAHPDRTGGDAAAMAECNARIDAALAALAAR